MNDTKKDPKRIPVSAAALRKRAEKKAGTMEPISLSSLTPKAIQQMVHELQVHQIELEMQNEELRRAQAEIEAGRKRYFDLYDLAPMGYVTVSKKGHILEANLTAATLLGVTRGELVKKLLTSFILNEDQDIYYLHRKSLFENGEPQMYELRLVGRDAVFWARLNATLAQDPNGSPVYRVTFSDITEHKNDQELLKHKNRLLVSIDDYFQAISFAPPEQFFTTIVTKLKEITGAAEVIVNDYDMEKSELTCRQTTLSEKGNTIIRKILGDKLNGLKSPVGKKTHVDMMSNTIGRVKSLHEASFGAIPKQAGRIIEKMFGLGWFVGLALKHDEQLLGTILIAGKKGTNEPGNEELLAYLSATTGVLARRKAELELAHTEERFRSLIEKGSDVIMLISNKYLIEYASPSFEEVFGKPDTEFLNTPITDFYKNHVHPDHLDSVIGSFEKCVATPGHECRTEFQFKHADGTWHYFVAMGHNHLDTPGVNGLVVNLRDITDRKTADMALIASETRYRRLFESAKDGILILDADSGNIVDVNPFLIDLLGIPCDKFLGKKLWEIGFFKDIAANESNFLELKNKGYVRYEDMPLKTKDGRSIDVEFVSNVYDVNHSKVIQCNIRDITDRKRGEEKLRQSENKYRSLVDQSSEMLFLHDIEGNLVEINAAAAKSTRYSKDELEKMNIFDIDPDANDRDDMCRKWRSIRLGDPPVTFEARHRRKDGSLYPAEVTISKIEIMQDNFILGLAKDITERKRSIEHRRRNEERLESLIRIMQHQTHSVQEFLDHALDEAIKLTESNIGYIYFYSEESKEFTLNTWSKGVMDVCSIDEPQSLYKLEKTGIWGEAVRQRKEIVINDFKSPDPHKKGYPEGHAPLHNFLTVPVFSGDSIVAVVGVSNKKTDYDRNDVLQLQLLMDGVWKEVERKRSAIALKESEENFRLLAQNTLDVIWKMDLDLRFTYVNPASESMLGYTPDEFIGTQLSDHCSPEKMAHMTGIVMKKLEDSGDEKGVVFETVLRHKDGREVPCEIHGRLLLDDDGIPSALQGTTRDITERKEREQEIEDLNSFLLSIMNLNLEIMKQNDFKALLEGSCRILTEIRGYMDVSIFYADEKGRIGPVAHHGDHGHNPWTYDPETGSEAPECLREALRTKRPVIIRSHDDQCANCGFCSHDMEHQRILVPMLDKYGEVQGVIHTCLEPGRQLHPQEIALFEEVAGDLVFAHDKIVADRLLSESERKLMTRNQFIDSILENLNLGIAVSFMDSGKTEYVNPAFSRTYGWPAEDLTDVKRFFELVYPDPEYREQLMKRVMEDINSRDPERMHWVDARITTKTGEERFIEARNIPLPDQNLMISTVWDITDRNRAQEMLIESERKYRSLIETTSEGYWLVDIDGFTLEINDALCSMLGYEREEFIGKRPTEFMDDENSEIFENMFSKKTEQHQRTYDLQLLTKNGGCRDVIINATTVLDKNGSTRGAFAMVTNISDIKRANEALEREKRKSETLLDLISHDIGNIHQGILSSLELLSLDIVTEEMKRRNLDNIRNLANRSVHLVRNVIVLTRLESMDEDFNEIDVLESIERSISSCRSAFPYRTIRYDIVSKDDPIRIRAEPILGEVFFNLFHNGIKVQKGGDPRLETEVIIDREHSCVRIRISDWGPGIPDESKEKLLYRTRTPGEKVHSGIGLSLVRELVNRYNGSVRILDRIEGDPKAGACFELTFPMPVDKGPEV